MMFKNDRSWLEMAKVEAKRSPDPSNKLGAVIAHGMNMFGKYFNTPPAVLLNVKDVLTERAVKYPRVVHAEMWAVIGGWTHMRGSGSLYCTHPACSNCAKHLVAVGLRRLVTEHSAANLDYRTRWATDVALATQILKEGGVEVVVI